MLHTQTTSKELLKVLKKLMSDDRLADFRLVGGTALSLLRGHRISDDIDLFTFQNYGFVDFTAIENNIRNTFSFVINSNDNFPELKELTTIGLHLYLGEDEATSVKVDIINWNDPFHFAPLIIDEIRMATELEIATMKLDAISRGGRKKDFWDLAELLDSYSLENMMALYQEKYSYYDITAVWKGLLDFSIADQMPDPICLKGRSWEVIKREITDHVK